MMFLSKYKDRLKAYAARWLLNKAVLPLATYLNKVALAASKQAKDQHDKARLRLDICKRCPAYTKFNTCKECGCYMPAKVQLKGATCPQGRW